MVAHKYKNPAIESAMNNVLDTFSGADGGGSFWFFLTMIRALDEQAANGDEPAKVLLKILTDFSKLIDAAQQRKTNDRLNQT